MLDSHSGQRYRLLPDLLPCSAGRYGRIHPAGPAGRKRTAKPAHQFNSGRDLQLHLIDSTVLFCPGRAPSKRTGHRRRMRARGIVFDLRALGDRQSRGGDDRIICGCNHDLHRLDRRVGNCTMALAVSELVLWECGRRSCAPPSAVSPWS